METADRVLVFPAQPKGAIRRVLPDELSSESFERRLHFGILEFDPAGSNLGWISQHSEKQERFESLQKVFRSFDSLEALKIVPKNLETLFTSWWYFRETVERPHLKYPQIHDCSYFHQSNCCRIELQQSYYTSNNNRTPLPLIPPFLMSDSKSFFMNY